MKPVGAVRTQLYKILFWQFIIIMGLALVISFLQGRQRGLSAFLGGLTYWLPTFFFMWRVSAFATPRAAMQFMLAFFTAEAAKLVLSGLFFIFIIKYLSVDVLYGVMGLIGAIVAFWITSFAVLYAEGMKS